MKQDDFLFLLRVQRDDDAQTRDWFRRIVVTQREVEFAYLDLRWRNDHKDDPRKNKVWIKALKCISGLVRKKENELIRRARQELASELGANSEKPDQVAAMPSRDTLVKDCAKAAFATMWEEIEREIVDALKEEDSSLTVS